MNSPRTLHSALSLTPEKREFIRSGGEKAKPNLATEARNQTASEQNLGPQPLVPLTTRIRQQTSQSLRRAYLQQKLSGQLPDTQQEIIEEAIRRWLSDHGYLDEPNAP